ncbi:Winged helix-turn-helix domain-containing protein [Pararobbsia alpina]
MNASVLIHDDFAFGATVVVPRRREVLHRGVKVDLGARAFDLLLLLVESRGIVVSKDEIVQRVWNNRVVEDNTVEVQISALRRALGEDRLAIRTISGRGYQFVGDVESTGPRSDKATAARTEPAPHAGIPLPTDICPIIGREAALTDIRTSVQRHRLVTLVGTGGVGKTKLAFEAARQLHGEFKDGVCVAELAATTAAEHIPTTLALSLGYPPGDGTPSLDRLAPALASRHVLLVLDNCEHLVDGAAAMVERLLQAAPRITVLATSREPLRVPGETVYRVPSLEVPPNDDCETAGEYGAVRLFQDRAGAYIHAAEDPSERLRLESRICRRLDGIPLALQLAAACVPIFGLQGTADRLENRFQILTRGARTVLPRQQTLQATLDWSYSLLSETQQTVFRRLSLFAGAFSFESAQAMASCENVDSERVFATLIELVDKSLVAVVSGAGAPRYRLLESARAYGRDKLRNAGELHAWSRRHAAFYVATFAVAERQAVAREDVDWRGLYEPHLDDLRAAILWSLSADGDMNVAVELVVASIPFFMHLALLTECLANVDRAVAWLVETGAQADERHMKLYAARGMCLLCHTVAPITSDAFDSTVETARNVGNLGFQLLGMWGRWMCHYLNGEFAPAVELAKRFNQDSAQSPNAFDRLAAHRLNGMSHLFSGDVASGVKELTLASDARVRLTQAQRMRFLYDERMLSNTSLALALWFEGKTDDARTAARQAVMDARELDHPVSICYALSEGVCTLALLCGDEAELKASVDALMVETQRHSISTWRARTRMWAGLLELRAGNPAAYDQIIAPAMTEIGSKRFYVSLTPFVSETVESLIRHGKLEQATALIDASLDRAMRTDDTCAIPELLRVKAEVLLAGASHDGLHAAEAVLHEAMARAEAHSFASWTQRCAQTLEKVRLCNSQNDAMPESVRAVAH